MKADETFVAPEALLGSYAGFGSRAIARFVDLAVVSLANAALWGVCFAIAYVIDPPARLLMLMPCMGIILSICYFTVMTARSGQTFGKRYMGIQVQDADSRPPKVAASLGRGLVDHSFAYVIGLSGVIDYLWFYARKDRRTLHDLAAGTTVRVVGPFPPAAAAIVLLAIVVAYVAQVPATTVVFSGRQKAENMSPAIAKGDRWQVSKLAYRHRAPQTGDVVAFYVPQIYKSAHGVGRIVGVAGERLALRSGVLERLAPPPKGPVAADEVVVPFGSVAVLGDNRTTPEAGGYPRQPLPPHKAPFGAAGPPPAPLSPILVVPIEAIKGQVTGVTWPLWRIHIVR